MSKRTFDDKPATREQVPLLVGLAGASGSGKTFSALRLATGMQRVTGGEIFGLDTEHRRMLHYADQFKFRHIDFKAPFGSMDYLSALEHCASHGAGVVIVDSASHEHDGVGGVLETHEAELDRMAGDDYGKRNRMTFAAWAKPKANRRKLINGILQLGINAIFCYRAKPKLKIVPGKQPVDLGWMPICGEEMVFEMTANCLLYPNSGGVPTWETEMPGERQMMKLPSQFQSIFQASKPLDEDIGQQLAAWAAGDEVKKPAARDTAPHRTDIGELLDWISTATSAEAVKNLGDTHKDLPWNDGEKAALRKAMQKAYAKFGRTPTGREKRTARTDEPPSEHCDRDLGGEPCSREPGHDGDCAP